MIGTVVATSIGAIRSLIIASGLGPSIYGLWSIFLVVFSYSTYSDFGLISGMNKQVPHLRGKGKEEHAKEIRNNTFWTVIAISFLLNILLVATAIVFRMHFPSGIIVAVCLLAGSNMAFQIFNYLICLLRTDKHF